MNANAALTAHLARYPRRIDLGLARMQAALAALDHPERRLPPVIHIAGTNGKGSTLAYLTAMAQAAGMRMHRYTSPHLVHWGERIVCAGVPSSAEDLLHDLWRMDAAIGSVELTTFEALTVVAFMRFAAIPADLVLLETGLGGRLDATNVVAPRLSVITPIDLDHQEFLGADLETIATEKAGIIKAGVPAVIGRQAEEAFVPLQETAQRLGAPVMAWGRDFDAFESHGRLVVQTEDEVLDLPLPALPGRHQIDNAGLAVVAAQRMGWPAEAMAEGLRTVSWPARLQRLKTGPLAERALAVECELWLDGCHNPHGARAVAEYFADLDSRNPRPLVLIAGVLTTKDASGIFTPFAGLARAVLTVAIPDAEASLSAAEAAGVAQAAGLKAQATDSLQHALELAIFHAPARIAIIGSLYLAGTVLAENS